MLMPLAALLVSIPFTLSPQSKITIDGDSNLHPWSCTARVGQSSAEIDKSSLVLVRALTLQIPVAGIECGNGTMNGKLRDALSADKHPFIEYRLDSAEKLAGEGVKLKAHGTLTVAGNTRKVAFPVEAALDPDGSVIALGSIPLLMSEVGVEPPSAMLGLLKTADRITLKFEIRAVPAPVPHS